MNSRERVLLAINHQESDRVPIDLGGSIVSGIMAGALVRLRKHLGLDYRSIKVYDCFQMLGEVTFDMVEKFKLDLLPVEPEAIGFEHLKRKDYKPWTLFDGSQVLMPGNFNVSVSDNGDWNLHDKGDAGKSIIARMPKNGFYFDKFADIRWDPDYIPPTVASLKEERWRQLDEETLTYLQEKALNLRRNTDKALVLTPWSPPILGPAMVGSLPNWLSLLVTEPRYVGELFELATETALDNLELLWQAMGDSIDILHLDGDDFGAQDKELFSPKIFERYYEPCYRKQCEWIHENTPWKIAKHCCGSIPNLIEPMIRAGIDILNPVQTSAGGMDPVWLKKEFGDHMSFWGGGIDTQDILPFKSPDEVYDHVAERVKIFKPGGGFIWSPIHNIQYNVPPENIVAAIQAVHDHGSYLH